MIKKFLIIMIFFSVNFAFAQDMVKDEFIEELLTYSKIEKPACNTQYDYSSYERIPVKLKISQTIKTKSDDIYDNKQLEFVVRNPVKYKNKIIFNQGTKFTANVAIYIKRGMNGIPATMVIDNFRTDGISNKKIHGVYIKKGLNLTPLVLPIKWALTPIPGVGSLTNFIIGGNASITPNDTITVYYYPDWK